MLALRMRWILGVIRHRVGEAYRASERDESRLTDSAEGVSTFSLESELRRELEVAGSRPASPIGVNNYSQTTYGSQIGGGGNGFP